MGAGGPGLSNAAFNHGVNMLRATMQDTHVAALEFERNKANKTFTDYHGEALAQKMHRLCGVDRDDDLPPVHVLLVKSGKGRAYGIIGALFAERAEASPVPLAIMNAPLATTKLVEEVFRQYMPGGNGREFAKGLTPFAIVCEGHENARALQQNMQKAAIAESGTAMSLNDATSLIANDVRFPTQPYVAVEKLCGWSVVIDLFHGVEHPVAVSTRDAVLTIAPLLQRLASDRLDAPAEGMELICRVLFDMQQDYFYYLGKVASGATAQTPTYEKVINLVQTHSAESLAPLPNSWYLLVDCPRSLSRSGGAIPNSAATPAPMRVGSGVTVNPHVDQRLMLRYKESGHESIKSMLGNRNLEIPKHAGKPVCLAWALKGICAASCKRATEHARYSQATLKAIHGLLDKCDVANPQP